MHVTRGGTGVGGVPGVFPFPSDELVVPPAAGVASAGTGAAVGAGTGDTVAASSTGAGVTGAAGGTTGDGVGCSVAAALLFAGSVTSKASVQVSATAASDEAAVASEVAELLTWSLNFPVVAVAGTRTS